MRLVLLFAKFVFVYSQWYEKEPGGQTIKFNDTEDATKPIPARSPTECILKCQQISMDGYFIGVKEQCFCLLDKNDVLFSSEDEKKEMEGHLFVEHRVSLSFFTDLIFTLYLVQFRDKLSLVLRC